VAELNVESPAARAPPLATTQLFVDPGWWSALYQDLIVFTSRWEVWHATSLFKLFCWCDIFYLFPQRQLQQAEAWPNASCCASGVRIDEEVRIHWGSPQQTRYQGL